MFLPKYDTRRPKKHHVLALKACNEDDSVSTFTENLSITSNSSQKESNTPKTLARECSLGVSSQNSGLFSLASMLFTACERGGGTQRCNKCNLSWVVVSATHKDRVDLLLLNENSISHQIVTGTHFSAVHSAG